MPFEPYTAHNVEAAPVEWLWEERIPKGCFSFVAGRPGEGKSSFTTFLAAEISKHGNVLLSNMEDLSSFVKLRLDANGADTNRVFFGNPIFPRDFAAFREFVEDNDIRLVILDPIAAHFKVSIYQDQECRVVMSPLTKIAEETGCSIVGVHHTTKSVRKGAHPLEAIGGGQGGLTGAARAVYIWGPNPKNTEERVLAHVKSNVGAKRESVLFEHEFIDVPVPHKRLPVPVGTLAVLDDEYDVGAAQVLDPKSVVGDCDAVTKRAAAAEWLTEYLSLGPMPVTDLKEDAREDGFSWATVRRASKDVGIEIQRKGFGPGSHILWGLPEDHPALLSNDETGEGDGAEKVLCCDQPDLEQDDDGNIVCLTCGHLHGTQLDLADAEALIDSAFAPEPAATPHGNGDYGSYFGTFEDEGAA